VHLRSGVSLDCVEEEGGTFDAIRKLSYSSLASILRSFPTARAVDAIGSLMRLVGYTKMTSRPHLVE